jgi:hypothetical protein
VEEPPPITKLDIVDAFVDTAFGSDFNAYYSASLPSSFDVSTIPPPAFSEELDTRSMTSLCHHRTCHLPPFLVTALNLKFLTDHEKSVYRSLFGNVNENNVLQK